MNNSHVSVTAAPLFDPGQGRIVVSYDLGMTITEIVKRTLPDLPPEGFGRVRVALVNAKSATMVRPEQWARCRPNSTVRVVIRVVPGKGLRGVLQIFVAIAAVALGQYWAGPLSGALGVTKATAQGLIALGVPTVGHLQVDAIP